MALRHPKYITYFTPQSRSNERGQDNRSTLYRNIEKFRELELIQELYLPNLGKVYQFIWGRPVRHFYICKSCEKINKGDVILFQRIEKALRDIHDFEKSNLSAVFYGLCSRCQAKKAKKEMSKNDDSYAEISV
ncbi:MAG: hypothetical protein COV44_04025 [Deltaproteobacteria bacterium CG11_big_fil_rev_8_21_14_0_20_45_16]|nr:MAG: hypothetical protein COV44_04025 [Deltaproteobacteria bacterium CG11_big_fil_rev_8_21_14_0_20_45_16]